MTDGWNNLMHYRGTRHAKVLRQLVHQMCEADRDRISADRAQAVAERIAKYAAECHEGRAHLVFLCHTHIDIWQRQSKTYSHRPQ